MSGMIDVTAPVELMRPPAEAVSRLITVARPLWREHHLRRLGFEKLALQVSVAEARQIFGGRYESARGQHTTVIDIRRVLDHSLAEVLVKGRQVRELFVGDSHRGEPHAERVQDTPLRERRVIFA